MENVKPHSAEPQNRWSIASRATRGVQICVCVALLALGAAAAPAFRLFIPGRYVVVLDDPPVAARFATRAAAESTAAADYGRELRAHQGAVAGELAARHIRVTSQVSYLLNALFVSAPGHNIDELRAIPGVKSVTPMRRMRAHLNRALTLVNAQAAWSAVGGQSNAGKGIKIAVFDSGIDLTNPAFQDSSLSMPSGFPLCSGFPGSDTSCSNYTNSKVIVARSYIQLLAAGSGSDPAANSDPDDPFPHDRLGHGTATAMVAAGNTITAPAISTSGSAITMEGMAPKAYIGVYKIAGTFGFTDEEAQIPALEDAVKDGMDVISMSYGAAALSGCTVSNCSGDPLASAFETAATSARPAGSLASSISIPVIVTAAGNDGADGLNNGYGYPSFNTINSPSNAPDVISVGATTNSHIMQPNVSATAAGAPSNVKNIVALAGDSTFFPSGSGLVDVSKIGDPTACSALAANSLANSFALIAYSTCGFATPAINAQTAGAVGFVFVMPAGTAIAPFDYLSAPSGIDYSEYGPSVSISNSDGVNLQAYLDQSYANAKAWPQITIDLGGQEQDVTTLSQALVSQGYTGVTANMVASYSSFGPTPDGQLKPDIVATGGFDPPGLAGGFYVPTQTFDAYDSPLYSANGFMAVDGTSLSTPLVAGAAALVIQNRAAKVQRGTQVRSLIVNSSAASVSTDDFSNPVDAESIGAGLLDAGTATSATLTAEPATISFGILQTGSLPVSKSITLTNIGSNSVTLTASVSCCTVNGAAGALQGATVAPSLSSATLAAAGTATLTVTLSGSLPGAGEYSGTVTLQGSGTSVHIPFMLLVGSGAAFNIEPSFTPESTLLEAPPGTDTGGYAYVQVTDPSGVPVAGAAGSVSFTVSPPGSLTLNSVLGKPACSPASSTTTIVCPTDQFGWAWMDVVLGSGSLSAQPSVQYSAAGYQDYFYTNIQTAPAISVNSAGAVGVVDGASYLTTLTPGSYAAIFGAGLSDYTDEFQLECPTGPCVYPISFDGVTVSFDVPGATYPALPWFVSAGQVNIVVPWELQGQTSAKVKVSIDAPYGSALFGNVVSVPVSAYNPAFIVSCGPVCALDSNYNVITASNPAKRGQIIFLYANSLGPVTNPPGDGVAATASPLSRTTTTPVVTIGGAVVPSSDVEFSGLAPGFPALYQINVTVPQSAQTGSAVPISLQIGGVTSPASTVLGPVTIPVQ